LWRCDDGLFFEVSPLASDALLTMLHPLFKNVLQMFATSFRRIMEQVVLTLELPFHGWKGSEILWGEIWTVWWMF
jgi:hypothetical protein